MARVHLLLGALLALALYGLALAEPVPLTSGNGIIDKVEGGTVTIRPRGPDGRFMKDITLKVTGTSNFALVGTRKGKGKLIVTQKNVKAKDLEPKQAIHFIYTTVGDGPTLLSGVVQPSDEK
jgi:hypothetical protein